MLIEIFPRPASSCRCCARSPRIPPTQNRLKAAEALWLWEGDGRKLAAVLKDILTQQKGRLPAEYWKLLGQLGKDIEPVLPELFAQLNTGGAINFQVLRLLSEVAPRVKYRPEATELTKLADILKEQRPPGFRNYDTAKVDAALALIGFDHEKDKAVAVLKEELGRTKSPPLELFLDRIPALKGKLKGIVPELLAMAPRLTYEQQLFYRALARIDPEGMKARQADLEKFMRSPGLRGHAVAELLIRIDEKNPEAWKLYEKTLRNPNDLGLLQSLRSLEKLGPTARPLAPLVEKHLTHPGATERQAAAVCLYFITGDTKKTVPVLVSALKEQVTWHGGNELKAHGRRRQGGGSRTHEHRRNSARPDGEVSPRFRFPDRPRRGVRLVEPARLQVRVLQECPEGSSCALSRYSGRGVGVGQYYSPLPVLRERGWG